MKLGHKKIALGDSPGLIGRLHESSITKLILY